MSLLKKGKKQKRIIALHDLNDANAFLKKIQFLKENFDVCSIEELLTKPLQSKSQVAVTFDDGFSSDYEIAFPILKQENVPATFFICSGFVGLSEKESGLFVKNNIRRSKEGLHPLTKAQLQEIAAHSLFTIGSHTVNHFDIGTLHRKEQLEQEIAEDIRNLEQLIGEKVAYFAFPFGGVTNTSQFSQSYLQEIGIRNAFSIIPEELTPNSNPYFIGRDCLDVGQSNSLWNAWLSGGYDELFELKNLFKTSKNFSTS